MRIATCRAAAGLLLLALQACGGGQGAPAPALHALSGTVSGPAVAGIRVTLAGDALRSATTGASGTYTFTGLPDGTYRVTPSLAAHAFEPASAAVTLAGADRAGLDFTARAVALPAVLDGWSTVPSGTSADLAAVWSAAADDAWAAGSGGVMLHWDGRAWTQVPSGTTWNLVALWGASGSDVWAAGFGGILHWDGSAWTKALANGAGFQALWGSSPADVWAVGSEASGAGAQGVAARWDGSTWRSLYPGIGGPLVSVWGFGPDDVWAGSAPGSLAHWNGTAWKQAAAGLTSMAAGLWGAAPTDLWAAAVNPARWDGSAWTRPPWSLPVPTAIWGTDASDIWVVGDTGISHWDGAAWSSPASQTLFPLRALGGSCATDAWSVGASGAIHHFPPGPGRTISGQVVEGNGDAIPGAAVALSGPMSAVTVAASDGTYSFSGLAPGSYTLTPTIRGALPVPAAKPVALAGASVAAQDFAAQRALVSGSYTTRSLGPTAAYPADDCGLGPALDRPFTTWLYGAASADGLSADLTLTFNWTPTPKLTVAVSGARLVTTRPAAGTTTPALGCTVEWTVSVAGGAALKDGFEAVFEMRAAASAGSNCSAAQAGVRALPCTSQVKARAVRS